MEDPFEPDPYAEPDVTALHVEQHRTDAAPAPVGSARDHSTPVLRNGGCARPRFTKVRIREPGRADVS